MFTYSVSEFENSVLVLLSKITPPTDPTEPWHEFKWWKDLPDDYPEDNITVEPIWDAKNYTVQVESSEWWNVVPSITSWNYWDEVTVDITPNSWYELGIFFNFKGKILTIL